MKRLFSFQSWIFFGLLLVGLVLLVTGIGKTTSWFGYAAGTHANLVISASPTVAPMRRVWEGVAQGYEGENMFAGIEDKGRDLNLKVVRIDHVFDGYNLVKGERGNWYLDFSQLDESVRSILAMGAVPAFSLSYMPPQFNSSSDIIGAPENWNDWERLVSEFVTHYSSFDGLALSNVYYEVWNEPDLFGSWHYAGNKNYLMLYRHTAKAIAAVENLQPLYLGGPSTTEMYPNWLEALVSMIKAEGLRLDFLSWHLYNSDVDRYKEDIAKVRKILKDNGREDLQLIISEWGPTSEVDRRYDGVTAAAHGVAVVRELMDEVTWLWPFELKDGEHPDGKHYWGRWGMLTHDSSGATPKARYRAWQLLNRLGEDRLLVLGEGTWVRAIASKSGDDLRTVLVNYDVYERHVETVPVTFENLQNGEYRWQMYFLNGDVSTGSASVTNNRWETSVYMKPQSVMLLELFPINTEN